jgi:hypothetical protein
MSWSARSRRPSPGQARAFWSEALTDAARAGEAVRIACAPEDHGAIRREATRIGEAEGCDMSFDAAMPRIVSVRFSRRTPTA